MHWFAIVVATLVAVAIIVIGVMYLAIPWTAVRSFGLPLPVEAPSTTWWLRLKGVRDVVSGLVLLLLVVAGGPALLGLALAILALIPIGDMSLILLANGSNARAFSIHGTTAALMIAGAIPLVAGAA